MKTVNMHEAKTHLSRLVAEAVAGEPFVIARAGKPLVKVEMLREEPKAQPRRLGFMMGEMAPVSDEYFSAELDKEIEDSFYTEDPLLSEALESIARSRQKPA